MTAVLEQVEALDAETEDICTTLTILEDLDRGEAATHRMASVAGVNVLDMQRFLDGDVSLTSAARERLRAWASHRSSEIERVPYEIPTTTLPARERES